LPKLDGLSLCEEMRAEPRLRDIPVVLVSALFGRTEQRLESAPVMGALGKPVDLVALYALVERLLP
jgi:CheY-like chemotaxis protein